MEKTLESVLYDALHALCDGERGNTGRVAKRAGISQSYLNRLLTGVRPVNGITVGVIEKIFPNATLNLNGNGITQFASNVRVNNQSVNVGKSAETYRNDAMRKMVALDLSGDDLKKVLTALMEIEVN